MATVKLHRLPFCNYRGVLGQAFYRTHFCCADPQNLFCGHCGFNKPPRTTWFGRVVPRQTQPSVHYLVVVERVICFMINTEHDELCDSGCSLSHRLSVQRGALHDKWPSYQNAQMTLPWHRCFPPRQNGVFVTSTQHKTRAKWCSIFLEVLPF